MKTLVAAFEPFGGRSRNRALEAARLVDGVDLTILPVVFDALEGAIEALLLRQPDLLLLVGESAEARTLLVERIALNVAHGGPDNAGARPRGRELVPGGPLALKVAFDPEPVAQAVADGGVACEVSSHAGTFCCNAALYLALTRAPKQPLVAFVHVPVRWPWAQDQRAARGLQLLGEALCSQLI